MISLFEPKEGSICCISTCFRSLSKTGSAQLNHHPSISLNKIYSVFTTANVGMGANISIYEQQKLDLLTNPEEHTKYTQNSTLCYREYGLEKRL